MTTDAQPAQVYIHVPFCRSRCPFCRFSAGFPDASFSPEPAPVRDVVEKTIADILAFDFSGSRVAGITIGGGTPTILSAELIRGLISAVLASSRTRGAPDEIGYISLEVHPLDAGVNFLSALREAGARRASLGAQSFSARQLLLLGRRVTAEQNLIAFESLRSAGFDNVNIDILLGHPGSDPGSVLADLDTVLRLSPEHVALNTFYGWFEREIGRASCRERV